MNKNTNNPAKSSGRAAPFAVAGKSRGTYRISWIVGLLIVLILAGAGYGTYRMGKIGGEITEIAEHNLPLTGIVTKVTGHHLEQAIVLQRSLRYGAEMRTDPARRRLFNETVARFEALAATTDAEFTEAGAMVAKFISEKEEGHERAEFRRVEATLMSIGKAHSAYEDHARAVLEALRVGDVETARQTIEDVEAQEVKLDQDLKGLLSDLEAFTLESARTATRCLDDCADRFEPKIPVRVCEREIPGNNNRELPLGRLLLETIAA